MIQKLGHRPYESAWGFRDWVGPQPRLATGDAGTGRKGEFISDRLSIVVGSRPFLISGDLAGISVLQTISRSFEGDYAYE